MAGVIGDLSPRQLCRSLAGPGLVIDSGAVATRVFSPLEETAAAIRRAYGRYPLADESAVPHFRVGIRRAGGIRRWIRQQAIADVLVPAPITPMPVAMAPLVLEMALNWCVATRAHWYLVFHAAVVERNGRVLLIPGDTGQGKSTLCAALASSGWRLFSDEFGLFHIDSRQFYPNVRPVSLKNESIRVMAGRLPPNSLTPQLDETPKGSIAYLPAGPDAIARRHEPAPLGAVIFPHYDPGTEPQSRRVEPARAFISLSGGAANYEMQGEAAFRAIGDLVDHHPVYRITYPDLDTAIGLVREIENAAVHA